VTTLDTTDTSRIDLPWIYKTAFIVTVIFTLLFFLTTVAVALWLDEPSGQQQTLFSSCDTAWKAGFGAIIGLIGGKLTS
jgi:hypothetical protein